MRHFIAIHLKKIALGLRSLSYLFGEVVYCRHHLWQQRCREAGLLEKLVRATHLRSAANNESHVELQIVVRYLTTHYGNVSRCRIQ